MGAPSAPMAGMGACPLRHDPGFVRWRGQPLDAYLRRAVSPTQPWPPRSADVGVQTDISAVDACPFGYDEIEMDWGGIDVGRTPSPPLPVPFGFPEPKEHEAARLRIFVPAGIERAMDHGEEA